MSLHFKRLAVSIFSDEFTVSLRRPKPFINTLLHTMDAHQDKDWILSRVKIPPQNIGYQVRI